MSAHLDLDGLCDVLAGEGAHAQVGHVSSCADCRAALAEVEQAQEPVRAALAALPPPEVPADLAARLDAALLRAREDELRAREDEHPAREDELAGRRRRARVTAARSGSRGPSWLLGSAAAVVVVAALTGATVGLPRLGGRSSSSDSSASTGSRATTADSAGVAPLPAPGAGGEAVSSSTGTDYGEGKPALAAALPTLLRGGAGPATAATADPLARLHTAAGLADCLAGLASAAPVALDYARYAGAPALVVVLPAARPDRLDVYVVGAECRAGAEHMLLHTDLQRAS